MELAALDQFKKSLNLLLENCSKYFDDLLSGERSLPFGLLVFISIQICKQNWSQLDYDVFIGGLNDSKQSGQHMSRVVKKITFCICKNKDGDQLCGNREADQRL